MFNSLLIISLLFTTPAMLPASPNCSTPDTIPGALPLNRFDLALAGSHSSTTNTLLLNEAAFKKRFGRPVSSVSEFSEKNDKTITHYHYNGMEVWFMDRRLDAINITHQSMRLKCGLGPLFGSATGSVQYAGCFPGLARTGLPMDSFLYH